MIKQILGVLNVFKDIKFTNYDNLLVIFIGIIVLIASLYNLYKLILCNKIGEKEN